MRRIKFLRIDQGLTQRRLADLARLPRPELSRIESGRVNPTDKERAALARILKCDPATLLDPVTEASTE